MYALAEAISNTFFELCVTNFLAARPRIAVSLDGLPTSHWSPQRLPCSTNSTNSTKNKKGSATCTCTSLRLWLLFLFWCIVTTYCCCATFPPPFASLAFRNRYDHLVCVLSVDLANHSTKSLFVACRKFVLLLCGFFIHTHTLRRVKRQGIRLFVYFVCLLLCMNSTSPD